MQATPKKQALLLGSRLARRALMCTLAVAAGLLMTGYVITISAERQAMQEFISQELHLVNTGLASLTEEVTEASLNRPGAREKLLSSLRELYNHAHLSYLVLLNKDGLPLLMLPDTVEIPGLDALAAESARRQVLPHQEVISLGQESYLGFTSLVPRGEGLRIAYGLPQTAALHWAARLAELIRGPILAGLAAVFLLCVLGFAAFFGPLLGLLDFIRGRSSGQAARLPVILDRKDELGDFARLSVALLERVRELEHGGREVSDFLSAIAPVLERFEHGVVIADTSGRILMANSNAAVLLGCASLAEGTDFFSLLKSFMNTQEQAEFSLRLEKDGGQSQAPLQLGRDGEKAGRRCNLQFVPYQIIGADYILCLITGSRTHDEVEQLKARAAARAEELVHERTVELLKINEQLRRENSERRSIEQALVRAESRYREIVNNSIEGIFQRSPDGRLLSANASLARILGYATVEDLLEAYQEPGRRISYTEEMEHAITELMDIRGWVSNLEYQAVRQDGSPVWVAMNARRVADSSGETMYYEAFVEDITSRKKTEEKLVHQAFHDPLTGLPNRALFLDRLRMSLRRSKRNSDHLFAVLYLDLDRFKNINDSFGHSAGDKMLGHASEKLLQCVRGADTVARFGGDEFAVLLADLEDPDQAVLIAKRISAAFSEPVAFGGQEVIIGASIGIVLSNHEYDTPEEILRDADTAMYRAKMQGRRGYTVFNERMREETMAALELESDLRGAADRGEIEAFYQPLIDIETGKVQGFEALMRWRRNDEIISPMVFIPVAEETGIIYDLGLEMMNIVCRQVVDWTLSTGEKDFTVHINISSKQLMATRFWQDVQEILQETRINPRQLIFEITESVFLDYGSQVISIMNMVRNFGIRFCLDDFGTGFSSLSYLRLLPLESLKVDRSFIVELNTDNYSRAILRNLVAMGKDLDLKVISEGVDRPEQIGILKNIGCRSAQGFYFAKPLPAPDAVAYMLQHGCTGELQ